MWRVVYIAPSGVAAETIKEFLTREGFLVTIRPAGIGEAGGVRPFEVLVPQSEVEEAHEVLSQFLASRSASPGGEE